MRERSTSFGWASDPEGYANHLRGHIAIAFHNRHRGRMTWKTVSVLIRMARAVDKRIKEDKKTWKS